VPNAGLCRLLSLSYYSPTVKLWRLVDAKTGIGASALLEHLDFLLSITERADKRLITGNSIGVPAEFMISV